MIYDEDEKNSFPLPLYEYDDARRFFFTYFKMPDFFFVSLL